MSIQNFGTTIRLARKVAGLTQEKLSEGICSASMLSQIESGTRGVSASTFEALMTRAGRPTHAIPCFRDRNDFDCFYSLKRAHFYISSWQLQKAYDELDFIELHHWADNKLHYAEWLLLHAKIQFYSGNCNHEHNYQLLLQCLSITQPNLSVLNLSSCLLSLNEIETLIMLAQEAFYIGQIENSHSICLQLKHYLEDSAFSYIDKSRLLAEIDIILIKYHLANTQYILALSLAEAARKKMTELHIDMPLLQLTFLHAICLYHLGQKETSIHLMKITLYSAHAIGSCYSTICTKYIREHFVDLPIESIFPLDDISLSSFAEKTFVLHKTFSTGTFNFHSPNALSLGGLIHQLRKEQNVSLEVLSQGLCSIGKLAKIEKNQQRADILLLEALLQRLGISERPFCFLGNDEENRFHDLKFKSIHARRINPIESQEYLAQMKSLASNSNPLQMQLISFFAATQCSNATDELDMYFEALHYTLPNFDINRILEYRLSWIELSILNNIAKAYTKVKNSHKSFHYFGQLLSYYDAYISDVLFRQNTYPVTVNQYCINLYNEDHFEDFIKAYHNIQQNASGFPFTILRSIFFYYSQALGECHSLQNAQLYGNYCVAMQYLMNFNQNALILKQYLLDDFSIVLDV